MSLWCRPRLIPYSGVYGVAGAGAPVDSRVRGVTVSCRIAGAMAGFRGALCVGLAAFSRAVMDGGLAPLCRGYPGGLSLVG